MPEQKKDDKGLIQRAPIVGAVKGLGGLIPGVPQGASKDLGNAVYHIFEFVNKIDDSLVDTS
jgi:hypothetical protein